MYIGSVRLTGLWFSGIYKKYKIQKSQKKYYYIFTDLLYTCSLPTYSFLSCLLSVFFLTFLLSFSPLSFISFLFLPFLLFPIFILFSFFPHFLLFILIDSIFTIYIYIYIYIRHMLLFRSFLLRTFCVHFTKLLEALEALKMVAINYYEELL